MSANAKRSSTFNRFTIPPPQSGERPGATGPPACQLVRQNLSVARGGCAEALGLHLEEALIRLLADHVGMGILEVTRRVRAGMTPGFLQPAVAKEIQVVQAHVLRLMVGKKDIDPGPPRDVAELDDGGKLRCLSRCTSRDAPAAVDRTQVALAVVVDGKDDRECAVGVSRRDREEEAGVAAAPYLAVGHRDVAAGT